MKKVLFIVSPIFLAIVTFTLFSFILAQNVSGKGALQVTAIPQSAIYLNGKLLGKTPLCLCEGKNLLPTGDYTLKMIPIAGDNLEPYEQKIHITKSILTVVDRTFGAGALSSGFVVNLSPLSDTNAVQIFVSSFPSGAKILFDNNDSGATPLLLKNITPSDHDIVLSKDGYKSKTVHVQTHPGYQLNATIFLSLLPPDATSAALFDTTGLTPVEKQKVVILDTPTGFLRVRTEPSVSGSESAEVKPGQTFDVTSEQDGWYQIKLQDGTLGWIISSYAKKQ